MRIGQSSPTESVIVVFLQTGDDSIAEQDPEVQYDEETGRFRPERLQVVTLVCRGGLERGLFPVREASRGFDLWSTSRPLVGNGCPQYPQVSVGVSRSEILVRGSDTAVGRVCQHHPESWLKPF